MFYFRIYCVCCIPSNPPPPASNAPPHAAKQRDPPMLCRDYHQRCRPQKLSKPLPPAKAIQAAAARRSYPSRCCPPKLSNPRHKNAIFDPNTRRSYPRQCCLLKLSLTWLPALVVKESRRGRELDSVVVDGGVCLWMA